MDFNSRTLSCEFKIQRIIGYIFDVVNRKVQNIAQSNLFPAEESMIRTIYSHPSMWKSLSRKVFLFLKYAISHQVLLKLTQYAFQRYGNNEVKSSESSDFDETVVNKNDLIVSFYIQLEIFLDFHPDSNIIQFINQYIKQYLQIDTTIFRITKLTHDLIKNDNLQKLDTKYLAMLNMFFLVSNINTTIGYKDISLNKNSQNNIIINEIQINKKLVELINNYLIVSDLAHFLYHDITRIYCVQNYFEVLFLLYSN